MSPPCTPPFPPSAPTVTIWLVVDQYQKLENPSTSIVMSVSFPRIGPVSWLGRVSSHRYGLSRRDRSLPLLSVEQRASGRRADPSSGDVGG